MGEENTHSFIHSGAVGEVEHLLVVWRASSENGQKGSALSGSW